MKNTLSGIQSLANDMFEPALAKEIFNSASADQKAAEANMGEMGSVGIGTFFAGDRLFRETAAGRFAGLPSIVWNGLFDDGKTPKFVYIPDGTNPFSFTTSKGRTITPGLMDTDGGSIPRILHGISKFSPWGYAPAYIIHDWIFIAHKCGHSPDSNISFEESATILAECIKTMMAEGFTDFDGNKVNFEKAEDTMYLIYKAVASSIARRIWDDQTTANCR